MSTLPAWARSAEARTLVAEAIAANPDCAAVSSAWGFGQPAYRYQHPAVRKLRALHEAAYMDAIDRHNAGELTRDEALALVREDADMLVERLLNEGFAETAVVDLGDGLHRVAA